MIFTTLKGYTPEKFVHALLLGMKKNIERMFGFFEHYDKMGGYSHTLGYDGAIDWEWWRKVFDLLDPYYLSPVFTPKGQSNNRENTLTVTFKDPRFVPDLFMGKLQDLSNASTRIVQDVRLPTPSEVSAPDVPEKPA